MTPLDHDRFSTLARIDAARASIESAIEALARSQAARSGRDGVESAIADGRLLAAAPALAFLTSLRRTVVEPGSLRVEKGVARPRTTLAERLARPGLQVRVVTDGSPGPLGRPLDAGTKSLVYSDALALSVGLDLALEETLVRGATVTLVVDAASVAAVNQALGSLATAGDVEVVGGGIAEVAARADAAQRVVLIASEGDRDSLRARVGDRLAGFASDTRSQLAIVPFLYARDELAALVAQVVREIVAPGGASSGVQLVLSSAWLQRDLFLGLVRDRLAKTWPSNAPGFETTELGRGADDDALEFLERLTASPPSEGSHLFSIFAHPMSLERPTFSAALAKLVATRGGVVAVGTRASVAWTLGGPPVGPSAHAVQNGWGVGGVQRVVLEAPLRRRPVEGRRPSSWATAFEASPTVTIGARLGLASVLPWPR